MTKLKAIKPKEARPSKPKVLIFGPPGVGKTFISLDFPSCYFIDTEGGATRKHYTDKLEKSGGMYLGVEHGSLDFNTVVGQIQALATEKHEFKTVVIDSFTKLYNTCAAEAAESGGDDFGRDKKEANKPTRRLIKWINKLDMTVLLIAHEKARWGIDAKGNRSEIGVTFDAYDKMEYELDLSLNIFKIGNSRRAKVQKSRLLGFPETETFPWSYEEFAKRYGKDIIEGDVSQLILATESQLRELRQLLDVIKLPDGQVAKWLTAANAQTVEELDTEKADALIKFIKTKYIKGDS